MESIVEFFQSLHGEHLRDLIQWGGYTLLFAIVYAETGLLVGFFLPGDTLLFTAGALVGTGLLKAPRPLPQDPLTAILILNAVLVIAAITGDSTGYWFGRKTGPRLFNRPDSRFFRREHLLRAQAFYEHHGGKTIVLARWVPFVRTFAPIVAGIAAMPYRTFMAYNVMGGITWVLICTLIGFFLGQVSFVQEHGEKVILVIVLLSVLPAVYHVWKGRRKAAAAAACADGADAPP
jgi:membrane-associated protein